MEKKSSGTVARITKLFNELMKSKWTLAIAIVRKVNNSAMTCDVELKIRGEYPFNIIEDVPVVFPKGGSTILLMPITIGDVVLVGFSKYSISDALIDNQVVYKENIEQEPKFQIVDAVVIAGFTLENDPYTIPTDCAEITGSLQVDGPWLGCPKLTQTEINDMIIGWGNAEAGRIWFNTDISQWQGWDGSLVQTFGFVT